MERSSPKTALDIGKASLGKEKVTGKEARKVARTKEQRAKTSPRVKAKEKINPKGENKARKAKIRPREKAKARITREFHRPWQQWTQVTKPNHAAAGDR